MAQNHPQHKHDVLELGFWDLKRIRRDRGRKEWLLYRKPMDTSNGIPDEDLRCGVHMNESAALIVVGVVVMQCCNTLCREEGFFEPQLSQNCPEPSVIRRSDQKIEVFFARSDLAKRDTALPMTVLDVGGAERLGKLPDSSERHSWLF
jgi:hypothetical protein